ncbi:NAD-dependent epimerase/dehydratase family protein [Leptospira kanakyensis]|uniref:NAD-dependent epimerase/dehydratase family protein n=1 Tax=Leptospira kanakyensis TaxID=2484968 RepID=UPI00223DCC94|nr:SDR family oxidoreductase [Leptospira kanakyensis]MCW7471384.1 SDR family oxidoreductase [Leptospira kanakyensis]
MKKILLTGAGGLLGGRIYSSLKDFYQIYPVSRKESSTCIDPNNSYMIDWSSSTDLYECVKGKDIIIHAAGLNSLDSNADPELSYEVNTLNTQRLVDACSSKKSPPVFIYLSTAHVYKSSLDSIVTEDSPTINCHPYASSHKAAEDTVLYATSLKKIRGVVLRLSNAFGAPLKPDINCWMLLVNDLVRQGVSLGHITLSSNGLQKRNFISIEFLLKFLYRILEIPYSELRYNLFNVGSESNLSVWDMATIVQARLQYILKKEIPLERDTTVGVSSDFLYSVDRLKDITTAIDEFQIKEIDDLITFCIKHF